MCLLETKGRRLSASQHGDPDSISQLTTRLSGERLSQEWIWEQMRKTMPSGHSPSPEGFSAGHARQPAQTGRAPKRRAGGGADRRLRQIEERRDVRSQTEADREVTDPGSPSKPASLCKGLPAQRGSQTAQPGAGAAPTPDLHR